MFRVTPDRGTEENVVSGVTGDKVGEGGRKSETTEFEGRRRPSCARRVTNDINKQYQKWRDEE